MASGTLIGPWWRAIAQHAGRDSALRETDPDVDALICELRRQLVGNHNEVSDGEDKYKNLNPISTPKLNVDELADLVAKRVCLYLEKRLQHRP